MAQQGPGDYQNISYQPGQQQPIQQNPQGFNPPPQQQYAPPGQQQNQFNPPPMAQNNQPVQQGGYQQFENQPLVQQQPQNASPIDKLMHMNGVFIKQKVNFVEAFTGCIQRNRYTVFSADEGGQQNSSVHFMEVKEESGCCQRQCLPSHCREFELKFTLNIETYPGSGIFQDSLVISARKDCSCTFFCLDRPELNLYLQTPQAEVLLGKIKNPYYCCHLGVETYNSSHSLYSKVIGSCCQMGVLCAMPCQPCQEVDFNVVNAQGEVVVPLKKKTPGCWRAMLGPTDYFSVIFPGNANRDERVLILASALMLDYMYFNDRPEEKKENQL